MGSPSNAGRTRGFASAHWFAPQRLLQTSCCRLNFWSVMEHMMITKPACNALGTWWMAPCPLNGGTSFINAYNTRPIRPLIRYDVAHVDTNRK